MSDDAKDRVLLIGGGFAAVNKRVGEVCEETDENRDWSVSAVFRPALETAVGRRLPDLGAVHRLDRPVSGCVILALDKASLSGLSERFAAREARKVYWAVVERPSAVSIMREGRLDHLLRFDPTRQKAQLRDWDGASDPGAGPWRTASLRWRLRGEGDRYLFLEVEPLTGRAHQIRAQLAAAGMPIKGDLKYGARRSERAGGIRLHARSLSFDGLAGEPVSVEAPLIDPDPLWLAFEEAGR